MMGVNTEKFLFLEVYVSLYQNMLKMLLLSCSSVLPHKKKLYFKYDVIKDLANIDG